MWRMSESHKPLSLLMIEIDHFKQVNDTFGHAVGDEVLCEVAQRIARNVRGFDLAARYGGEEFVVSKLPQGTMPLREMGIDGL